VASVPPAEATTPTVLATAVVVQPARVGFPRGDHIDALSALIAKKYRVSEQATRGLVAAAYREGLRNGVDPLLLLAVIAIESRFNPIAQSDGGAVGLMQVIPHYHADKLGAIELASVLEPHMNIQVGARILKDYIARGGNEVAGLQLYNGASADASNAYANRVLGEKQWLQNAIARSKERARA
jgi:soluble lytic murein transglycosylase-like protein